MSLFRRHPPAPKTKKEKKKAQQKKNRFQEEIFNALRQRRAEEVRVKGLAGIKPKAAPKTEAHVDKVARIRNRLTGKQRLSKERWNRFSGTGDEGGRGL